MKETGLLGAFLCFTCIYKLHEQKREMVNVAVIIRLLVDPLSGTFFDPFAVIVLLEPGMYFDGVWSTLKINDRGMSFPSIF